MSIPILPAILPQRKQPPSPLYHVPVPPLYDPSSSSSSSSSPSSPRSANNISDKISIRTALYQALCNAEKQPSILRKACGNGDEAGDLYSAGLVEFRNVLSRVERKQETFGRNCSPASERTMQRSWKLMESSADKGYGAALNHLGVLYLLGLPPCPHSESTAFDYFHRAVDRGNRDAQYNLALLFLQDSSQDPHRTISASQAISEKWDLGHGDPNKLYGSAAVERDTAKGMRLLEAAAEEPSGHALAQSLLGLCYMRGLDRRRDPRRAAKLWALAAQKNEAESLFSFGLCNFHGVGVENRNITVAKRLWRLSARAGNVKAMAALGRHLSGEEAAAFTARAANEHYPPAQYEMSKSIRRTPPPEFSVNRFGKIDLGLSAPPLNADASFRWSYASAKGEYAKAMCSAAQALFDGWGREAEHAEVTDEAEEEAKDAEQRAQQLALERDEAAAAEAKAAEALREICDMPADAMPVELPEESAEDARAQRQFVEDVAANDAVVAAAEADLGTKQERRRTAEANARQNACLRRNKQRVSAATQNAASGGGGGGGYDDELSQRPAQLKETFDALDEDGSGSIAAEELTVALGRLGHHSNLTEAQCRTLLARIDTDNDGSVSFEEFCAFFQFVDLDERLKAEASAVVAKDGQEVALSTKRPMGMVINPDGGIGSVKEGGQAEAAGLSGGCRIVKVGEVLVSSLAEIKAEIKAQKSGGCEEMVLCYVDPRRIARANAAAAQMGADSSAAAHDSSEIEHRRAEEASAHEVLAFLRHGREEMEKEEKSRSQAAAELRLARLQMERIRLKYGAEKRARHAVSRAAKAAVDAQARADEATKKAATSRREVEEAAAVEARALKPAAVQLWAKASECGNCDAMHKLAAALLLGDGASRDPEEAARVLKVAAERGHAPSMHALAAAYMAGDGVVLRFGAGLSAQLDTATELFVKAARQGYAPSQLLMYNLHPLSFSSAEDFLPLPLPPVTMMGCMIGRRVEIMNDTENGRGANRRFDGVIFTSTTKGLMVGRCGTVTAVTKAKLLQVKLDTGHLITLRRRRVMRPYISSLDNRLRKAMQPPPSRRSTFSMDLVDNSLLGLDADHKTLLVTHVKPRGQAWQHGVRAGCTIVEVEGKRVDTLLDAKAAIFAARRRGDASCDITVERPGVAASMVGF